MRSLVVILTLLVFARPQPEPSVCDGPPSATASAFAVLDRRGSPDSVVTLTVCLVADSARLRIGGYHAELALPHSHRILKVGRPKDGTRIENTTTPGRVSFAGVAAAGLAPGPQLTLTITRRALDDDARVRLAILDITDIKGRDVATAVRVDSMPRLARVP